MKASVRLSPRIFAAEGSNRGHSAVSWCRFCGAENGSSERSDGVYLWPEGLAHYIRRHNVRLPAAVIEHILCALRSPDHDALRRVEADVRGSPRDVVIAKAFWARARLD
jgi:hypothetical protein